MLTPTVFNKAIEKEKEKKKKMLMIMCTEKQT